jgi:hypothetical protein
MAQDYLMRLQASQEKELTLFVEGDRGGKLIATNVCDNAKIALLSGSGLEGI